MKSSLKVRKDVDKQHLVGEIIRLLKADALEESETLLAMTISQYPHDPEPHNLYGVLMVKRSDHNLAMKHFRASWDLDPTYLPARHNLEHFGTFFSKGHCAYEMSDCAKESEGSCYEVVYDEQKIGRVRRKTQYDKIRKH